MATSQGHGNGKDDEQPRIEEVRRRMHKLNNDVAALSGFIELGDLEGARKQMKRVMKAILKLAASVELVEE